MADPAGDFLAAHALASRGDPVANLEALVAGSGGTPAPSAPQGGTSPVNGGGTAVPSTDTQQSIPQQGTYRPIGARVLDAAGQLVSRFTGDVAGSFEQLKTDWIKQHQLDDAAA